MKITCYKCEKKYSDKLDRCPICYKVEKDKSKKNFLLKFKKILNNYIRDIKLIDRDVYDNGNKKSLLFFMEKKEYCNFCGGIINSSTGICPLCFSCKGTLEKNEKHLKPTSLYEILDEVIQEKIEAKESKISFDKLNDVFKKNNYDLKSWLATKANFSIKKNIKLVISIYLFILTILLLKNFKEGGFSAIIFLAFIAIIGSLLIPSITKILNYSGLFMALNGKIEYIVCEKYNGTIFSTNTKSVEKIDIEIDKDLKVSKITIYSNPKSGVNSPIFQLDVFELWNRRQLSYFTILFCLKLNIELNIISSENINEINIEENINEINIEENINELLTFVRIDKKIGVKEISEDDSKLHFEYLTKMSNERELTGGGFKDKDMGMLVFKAKDFEEASKISEKDPIISLKYYTYELFQWDVEKNTNVTK